MALEYLKSAPITSLDATPPVRTTSGRGANGLLHHIDGTITGTTLADIGSTYRMVRVPSEAIIKELWAMLDTAVTSCVVDIGVYYSSATGDAPPGTVVATAIDADLFGSAVALTNVVVPTQYTHEAAASAFAVADMFMPLWQAAGLSADPKCGLDIVFTATTAFDGAPIMYCAVKYVLPGA